MFKNIKYQSLYIDYKKPYLLIKDDKIIKSDSNFHNVLYNSIVDTIDSNQRL